jgi:hypothetical protein
MVRLVRPGDRRPADARQRRRVSLAVFAEAEGRVGPGAESQAGIHSAGDVIDRRRTLLTAALGFLRLPPRALELRLLHRWLDTWAGIGHVVVGMERMGYFVSIKRWHDGGWTPSFGRDVATSADGFGSGPAPWCAVQAAAWEAMKREASDVESCEPRPDN